MAATMQSHSNPNLVPRCLARVASLQASLLEHFNSVRCEESDCRVFHHSRLEESKHGLSSRLLRGAQKDCRCNQGALVRVLQFWRARTRERRVTGLRSTLFLSNSRVFEQACLDSLRQLASSLASESCDNTQDCLILRSNSGRLDLYCVPGSKTNRERPSKHSTDGSHQLQVGLHASLFGALKTNCKLNTAANLQSVFVTCRKTLDFGFWRSAVW